MRTEQAWLEATLRPFKGGDGECEVKEKEEMAKRKEEAPLPTSISQFKGHPLYVLQRHLLKFEAIYLSTHSWLYQGRTCLREGVRQNLAGQP